MNFARIVLSCLIVTVLAVPVWAQQATQFSAVISDLPLMDQMVEDEADDLVFDKAEGRILQTSTIVTQASADDVFAFYSAVLPQMGWSRMMRGEYKRSGEILSIQTERIGADVAVKFLVQPQ